MIEWVTYSELNNDYFTIEYSMDGINWRIIHKEYGNGTTNELSEYMFKHRDFEKNNINYYRLSQTDFDGVSETFNIVSIDNRNNKKVDKIINMLGQEVDNNFDLSGIFIYIYTDGTIKKVYH